MDILNELQERYDEMCQSFDGGLSNTSTKKFDPIRKLFADKFNIPMDDIYAVGSGTRPGNIEVRLSQGMRATTHTKLGLTFIVDEAGTEDNRNKLTKSAFVTVEKFMGRGKSSYENILVIIDSKGTIHVTGLVHSTNSNMTDEIAEAFGITNVKEVAVPNKPSGDIHLDSNVTKEQLINEMKKGFVNYFSNYLKLSTGKCDEAKIAQYLNLYEKQIETPLRSDFDDFDSIFQYVTSHEVNNFFSKVERKYPKYGILLLDKWPEEKEKQTLYYEPWTMIRHYKAFLDLMGSVRNISMVILPRILSLSESEEIPYTINQYIRAIRTKPFVLLAGISGTGKSRIVRQLAKACWPEGSAEAMAQKPSNFEMVQVKPNWHDSSELLGYVSRIGKEPKFIAGDFLKFIAKAWENTDTPYFLCLDEMNLAPVEQYFAEYLSVVESRKLQDDGKTIISDPILKKEDEQWYYDLANSLTSDEGLRNQFLKEGIAIPQNLIVIGTVNMDETTYSFSRKVLDRAMTIEMNEVDLNGGLQKADANIKHIPTDHFLADAVEGYDVYEHYKEACDIVINYLEKVNGELEGTPFKVAYRTRNEFLIYVVNALRLAHKDDADKPTIAQALDEVTSMKILSRIEGDKRKVHFIGKIKEAIKSGLNEISEVNDSVSLAKLKTMGERLESGYTSFWD